MTADRSRRVLVINDDPAQLRMVGRLVEKCGYEALLHDGAEEALRLLQSGDIPDLIVTDLYMPNIDGWRFCRLVRSPAFPQMERTPILVVSATYAGADAEEITKQIGANAFLSAPYHPRELTDLMRKLIEGAPEQRRPSVLVVESLKTERDKAARAFRAEGFRVSTAQNGETARKQHATHDFDVVVLDHHLPDAAAAELLPLFKFQGSDRAVVVATEDRSPQLAVDLLKAGADAYVHKPFDAERLVDLANKALRERALLRVQEVLQERTHELRASEARYRAIVEDQTELVFRLLPEGRLTFVNDAFCRFFGKRPEELIGHSFLPLVAEEDREKSEKHPAMLSRQKAVASLEHRVVDSEGRTRWLYRTDRAIFDETGQAQEYQCVAHEITDRKEMMENLLDNEELLRATLEASADGMLVVNERGQVVGMNAQFKKLWRVPKRLVKCEEHQELLDYMLGRLREPGGFVSEFQDLYAPTRQDHDSLVLKDGRIFEHVSCPLVHGARIAGRAWSFRNVTEQKRAEEALRVRAALDSLRSSVFGMEKAEDLSKVAVSLLEALKKMDVAFVDCSVQVVDEASQNVTTAWRAQGEHHWEGVDRSIPTPLKDTAVYAAWSGQKVVYRRDLEREDPYGECESIRTAYKRPIRSVIDVPFSCGTIAVNSVQADAFSEMDIDSLKQLANVVSEAYTRFEDIQRIEQSEERHRTVVEHANEAILVAQDERIQYSNPKASVITGYTSEELSSRPFIEFVHPEDREIVMAHHKRRLQGQPVPEVYSCRAVTKSGHVRWIEINGVPIEWGGRPATLNFVGDITERKKAEEALREERASLAQRVEQRTSELTAANLELERTARLKDEFLASMSHELRTPLSAILGMSESLQEEVYGPLSDKQRRSLQTIAESGRHLLELINDVLDLAKIGSGELSLEMGEVNLGPICEASLRLVTQAAKKKRLKLSSTLDSQTPTVLADPRRLKQILVNLLSNAVKFTPQGGAVGLEVQSNPESRQVELAVWDTGIGIPAGDIDRLFEPFVQLDSRLSREYGGTGLGLALARRLTELQGGKVTVESQVGKGSRFTVSIPWREPDSNQSNNGEERAD